MPVSATLVACIRFFVGGELRWQNPGRIDVAVPNRMVSTHVSRWPMLGRLELRARGVEFSLLAAALLSGLNILIIVGNRGMQMA